MTQIWAHRGASAAAPENTLAAFDLAVRQGAQGVELDVQRSVDGTVVVIHDETVDRTTRGTGRVVDLTAHLGLAQSTVSAHLACLRDCGLVAVRPEGRSTRWSLARPELMELLDAAERLLAATGHAVVLCPTSGPS